MLGWDLWPTQRGVTKPFWLNSSYAFSQTEQQPSRTFKWYAAGAHGAILGWAGSGIMVELPHLLCKIHQHRKCLNCAGHERKMLPAKPGCTHWYEATRAVGFQAAAASCCKLQVQTAKCRGRGRVKLWDLWDPDNGSWGTQICSSLIIVPPKIVLVLTYLIQYSSCSSIVTLLLLHGFLPLAHSF